MIDLRTGDCLEVMRTMLSCSVDSVVTDPPYGLTANKKGGSGVASVNVDSPYGRARIGTGNGSGGFMGLAWDSGVPSAEVWAEALRVLKPGGYLLAFGGTRTYHRMACAIEDGGFEIRDQIGWAFGSGFPKSHNGPWGGTALKPAWEPICVARKPLEGTVEANWREHGTGALNIDGCRVGEFQNMTPSGVDRRNAALADAGYRPSAYQMGEKTPTTPPGRWPANLIHDGSDEVVAAFPDAPGAMSPVTGDEPSSSTSSVYGKFTRAASGRTGEASANSDNLGAVGFKMKPGARRDATSAARFFYCAKADRADRNEGLQGMPTKDLNWSSGTQNPGSFQAEGTDRTSPNHHPTVKPTDLMRYLCRMVTPKGGLILDPFMGSGSTGRGAVLEGFRFVGIEREAEYMEIARARIDSARRQGHQPSLDLEAA